MCVSISIANTSPNEMNENETNTFKFLVDDDDDQT